MPRPRSAPVVAALLTLATACSSGPPTYALHGDACSAVPVDTFQQLSGSPPSTRTPSPLAQGLAGGLCEMEFDGDTGYVKVSTFIALHPTGSDAARAMYTEFRTHDAAHVADGATVTDVTGLGSAAYLEHRNLAVATRDVTEESLYRYGVQDGNLMLTVTFDGYGHRGADWPETEQALQDELHASVEKTLETLAT